MTVMLLFTACMTAAAQGDITSEENEETTDSPVFVPMMTAYSTWSLTRSMSTQN